MMCCLTGSRTMTTCFTGTDHPCPPFGPASRASSAFTRKLAISGPICLALCCFCFLGILTMHRPNMYFMVPLQEKMALGMFFLGAVLRLIFSWLFHTVYCLSEKVSWTFSKLDYSGIALLMMGSVAPWLYDSFYCSPQTRLIYLSIVCVLGISAIFVAPWDSFDP